MKHREAHAESQRRQALSGLAAYASKRNPSMALLGMSATPVVNDLHEARSLLELIEGKELDDVGVSRTTNDAMSIHQRLVRVGTRWIPRYETQLQVVAPEIDAGHLLQDLLTLTASKKASPAAVDALLLEAKFDTILSECRATLGRGGKVFVYTQFIAEILEPLTAFLRGHGIRVGHYTGEDKSGLSTFLGRTPAGEAVRPEEQVEVLIGSFAIATGLDGLQHVSDTLIFASLPWTHANYMQVLGRIYRQNQVNEKVRVIVPTTFVDVTHGEGSQRWSWDDKRWGRIANKRTLADCAVDGIVPEGDLVTPERATQLHLRWLERLAEGNFEYAERRPLEAGLGDDVDTMAPAERANRYGNLSRMNGVWGSSLSSTVHDRLRNDPSEWHRYHKLYRAARTTWTSVPALTFADWLRTRRPGQRVADLGCGEMLLADALGDLHDVDGFDHVAHDDRVRVCDIAAVPAPAGSYDYVVLSLALMGSNHTDYVREAYRLLREDGYLWLAEPTSHLGTDEARIRSRLRLYGFDVSAVEVADQFVLVRAARAHRAPTSHNLPLKLTTLERRSEGIASREDDENRDAGVIGT